MSRARRTQEHEQRGEADEAKQLGTIDGDRAREEHGRQRREDDREWARGATGGAPRGERDEGCDEQHPQDRDAAPPCDQIGQVHTDLSEPLIGRDRRAGDRPREDVRAHETGRERLASGREVPPHVRVVDRL